MDQCPGRNLQVSQLKSCGQTLGQTQEQARYELWDNGQSTQVQKVKILTALSFISLLWGRGVAVLQICLSNWPLILKSQGNYSFHLTFFMVESWFAEISRKKQIVTKTLTHVLLGMYHIKALWLHLRTSIFHLSIGNKLLEKTIKGTMVSLSCFSEGKRGKEKYAERIVDFAFDFNQWNWISFHRFPIQNWNCDTHTKREIYVSACMHVLHC